MFWFFLACARPAPVAPLPSRPRVPSLQAPVYVHVASVPTDPLVARSWPHPVDEALSGAAAALGLQLLADKPLDPAELRWRAVLAGYPWPIAGARTVRVAEDQVPADLLAAAETDAASGVGLGRAGDQWVLLVGGRRGTLPAFPREPDVGSTLVFPDAAVVAVNPFGARVEGAGTLTVATPGEWLVSLADSTGPVATFPLYVGRSSPQAPPFADAPAADRDAAPEAAAAARMDSMTAWYRRDAVENDPALAAVARARLRLLLAGSPLPDAPQQLAAAGFFDADAAACHAATVANCLDTMWWSVEGHGALAAPWSVRGIAAATDARGVTLVVAGADREDSLNLR